MRPMRITTYLISPHSFFAFISLPLLCLQMVFFPSCSSSPQDGNYRGYATKPYTIRGQHYVPMSVHQALNYAETGTASHYDESSFFGLSGGETSIGEDIHPWHLNAAHKTLPLPCIVRVTSLTTGKSVKVRVNDRGPFVKNRIIDLSTKAGNRIGMKHKGLEQVKVEVLSVGDGPWKVNKPIASNKPTNNAPTTR